MPTKSVEARRRYRREKKDRFLAAGLTNKGTPRKPRRAAQEKRIKLTPAQWAMRKAASLERKRQRTRVWRAANLSKANACCRAYYAKTPSRQREKELMRRTATSRSTPPWLTIAQREVINNWYHLAKMVGREVDHIEPLRGKNVCGLHVPWNLQLLSQRENGRKGNTPKRAERRSHMLRLLQSG